MEVIHNLGAKFGTKIMPLLSFESANNQPATDVVKLLRVRIRLERRRLGLSQAKFANMCGIPLRTYKRLELGGCDSIEVLVKVAQGFGRGAGFNMLFPPQPLQRRVDVALKSIRTKLSNESSVTTTTPNTPQ